MVATTDRLEQMTGAELVQYYNRLTGERVKKFPTRQAGIKRIQKVLEERRAQEAERQKNGNGGGRRKRFDLPPKKEIKGHREGTARAKAVELLSRKNGATFEEVSEANEWTYKKTYQGIMLLHTHLGYGLKEDDKGRIHLVTS